MTQNPAATKHDLGRAQKVSAGETVARPKKVFGLVHRELRTATLDDHALIDQLLLRFDLNRSADYRTFLSIHLTALDALRTQWRLQDQDDFTGMLRCVVSDLEALGQETLELPFPAQSLADRTNGLGTAYVIRGSRLGAAVLRRGVVSGLPTSYLDFAPTLSWTAFLLELESIASDAVARGVAIRSARSAFEVFARGFASFTHER